MSETPPCGHRGWNCSGKGDAATAWQFGNGRATRMRVCAPCAKELAEKSQALREQRIQGRAITGEPPEGSTVEVKGGAMDGASFYRKDSRHPVMVALGDTSQWWSTESHTWRTWDWLVADVHHKGGRLVTRSTE